MTALDLDAIEARADAAQPGPWWVVTVGKSHEDGPSHIIMSKNASITEAFAGGEIPQEVDAAFIAHARTDIPALVAAVRERDATIADLRARLAVFVERERLDARMIDDPDDCTPDYLDPETP